MAAAEDPGGRPSRFSLSNAYVVGQVCVVAAFLALWLAGGWVDVGGDDFLATFGIIAVVGTLPAIFTGVVAGFVTETQPRLRFWLLLGLALVTAAAGFAIAKFYTEDCPIVSRVEDPCRTSPHDPLGAFLGVEYVLLFQAATAYLGSEMRRRYPLRRVAD